MQAQSATLTIAQAFNLAYSYWLAANEKRRRKEKERKSRGIECSCDPRARSRGASSSRVTKTKEAVHCNLKSYSSKSEAMSEKGILLFVCNLQQVEQATHFARSRCHCHQLVELCQERSTSSFACALVHPCVHAHAHAHVCARARASGACACVCVRVRMHTDRPVRARVYPWPKNKA